MMTSPRVFNVGAALTSVFLSRIKDGKSDVVKDVYWKLRRLSNTGELELWLQRITLHIEDADICYEEPLTKIVLGNDGVTLWNNDWVKPELLNGFPLLSICDTVIRDSQKSVIAADEVSVFEYE